MPFLSTSDVKKSAGVDGISAHMLKLSAPCITHIFTENYILSITKNQFPIMIENGSCYTTFQERFQR